MDAIVERQKVLCEKYGKDNPQTSCFIIFGKFLSC